MNASRLPLPRLVRFASLLVAVIAFTGIAQAVGADMIKLPLPQIDLLYPRNGSSCSPSDESPVVAAIQNFKASHMFRPNIFYYLGTGTTRN